MKKVKMLVIALVSLVVIGLSVGTVSASYGMARPADPIPATSWQIYTGLNNWLQVFKTNNINDGICWEGVAFTKNDAGMPINNYYGYCTK